LDQIVGSFPTTGNVTRGICSGILEFAQGVASTKQQNNSLAGSMKQEKTWIRGIEKRGI